MKQELKIIGKLAKIVYESGDGYVIARFLLRENNSKLVRNVPVKGMLGALNQYDTYELTGYFTSNDQYGQSFTVNAINKMTPESEANLIKYFCSPVFPNVGPTAAKKIVDFYGHNAISLIKQDYSSLKKVADLTNTQIETIQRVLEQETLENKWREHFSRHQLNMKTLDFFIQHNNLSAVEKFLANPYEYFADLKITFGDLDKIYLSYNSAYFAPVRVAFVIDHLIKTYCFKTGDTYITYQELEKLCTKYFNSINFNSVKFQAGIDYGLKAQLIISQEECIFNKQIYNSELAIAEILHNINTNQINSKIKPQLFNSAISLETDFTYSDEQIAVINSAIINNVSIITGGPGTGKTTIMKGIYNTLKQNYSNWEIALLAPTGKAAKHLTNKTKHSAQTIHKFLGWDAQRNSFNINQDNPKDCQVLIIDEMSMVDSELFASLLTSLSGVLKIILVGDTQQLPSISCGNVLSDLIEAEVFNHQKLQKIYRQELGNDIVSLSNQLWTEEFSMENFQHSKDIQFIAANSESEILTAIENIVHNLEVSLDNKLLNMQVIAPMYNKVGGINAINKHLQTVLNPKHFQNHLKIGQQQFAIGDKVMNLKNHPELEIYNGDIGIINQIHSDGAQKIIQVNFENRLIDFQQQLIYELTLAYATSVHKMQGSECDVVIFVIHKQSSYMLNSQLIYTAITRAKQKLFIVGQLEALAYGVQKNPYERKTQLRKILKEY